ncbi:formate--phosphoribosylaminoimidazolecarboxamide ligase [archaeon]|nr:formate--phosphoribosylaminoimidazolecarboxamide ligase [archaeon]
MIEQKEMLEVLAEYDRDEITVATLGSHSALQILKGAKEEGFNTLALCKKGRDVIYRRFRVADEIMLFDEYTDMLKEDVLAALREKNCVMVPHGSLIAYIGVESVENKMAIPMVGTRRILRYDSDRNLERKWLEKAGIRMPKETKDPRDINGLSLVKFPGAMGGHGYFLVNDYGDFIKKSRVLLKKKRITNDDIANATIQEYVAGVNMYISYFYSPLNDEVELFGIDKRYESNVDGFSRIPASVQINSFIEPSYVVIGNFPIVARESLLAKMFEMGDAVVKVSKEEMPPGMVGPFCLESMVDQHLNFTVFEISARIVAGTNPFMNGSPYSYLNYGNNMSMGRRIAREIKNALNEGKEDKLIT